MVRSNVLKFTRILKIRLSLLVLIIFPFIWLGAEEIETAPHFKTIMTFMDPLEYSGVDELLKPDSKITLDFQKKTWTLNTVYSLNANGEIVLKNNKSALCRGLAMYIYQKILPLFPPGHYEISFAKVHESEYFFRENASHIILVIRDKKDRQEYLLDPSFKRYGKKESFGGYAFYSEEAPDEFFKHNQLPEKFFLVNSASPLFIKNKYLLFLSVQSIAEKFDENNFILTIAANRPKTPEEEYVLVVKCEDGNVKIGKNKILIHQLLDAEMEATFTQRLKQWSMQYCGGVTR